MVEVDGDGNIGEADGGLDELLEIDGVRILARALGDLQHHGRLFFFARFDDGLKEFHVVHVERAQGVFALERFREQVRCMSQWHKFFG